MLTGEAEMLSCAKFRHFSIIEGVVRILTIYKITCLVNQKVYVGQTSETIEKRFARHMGYQKEENDTKFYRAIRKNTILICLILLKMDITPKIV